MTPRHPAAQVGLVDPCATLVWGSPRRSVWRSARRVSQARARAHSQSARALRTLCTYDPCRTRMETVHASCLSAPTSVFARARAARGERATRTTRARRAPPATAPWKGAKASGSSSSASAAAWPTTAPPRLRAGRRTGMRRGGGCPWRRAGECSPCRPPSCRRSGPRREPLSAETDIGAGEEPLRIAMRGQRAARRAQRARLQRHSDAWPSRQHQLSLPGTVSRHV